MTSNVKRVAVVPGDGIGPEVVEEAVGVLERVGETHGVRLELKHFDWGADKFLSEGVTLPEGALEMLSAEFDAVLAGAFGDPRVPSNQHAEDILLGMRLGLDLYINLRPVRLLHERLTPLRGRTVEGHRLRRLPREHRGRYVRRGRLPQARHARRDRHRRRSSTRARASSASSSPPSITRARAAASA